MSVNIASACQRGQLVSWCQFAGASGHAAVHRLCLDFIKANFGAVAECADFATMELDLKQGATPSCSNATNGKIQNQSEAL